MKKKLSEIFGLSTLVVLATCFTGTVAHTQNKLELPIIEQASDDLDTCALAEVRGLKADGDGFLAVRAAPGASYTKLDELIEGQRIWVFQSIGDWYGVVYDVESVDCGPIEKNTPVRAQGKKGWVHGNWVNIIAG